MTLPLWIGRSSLRMAAARQISRKRAADRAMKWLCLAQDRAEGGGVSTAYDLRYGWQPGFPETTGYIAPTFFDYHEITGDENYRQRAIRMLEWLVTVQADDGSIHGIISGAEHPLIFDTGQVLFGFVRGYQETKNETFLRCARSAGDWLISVQDEDGKWSRFEFRGMLHTYNTRVAWALMELYQITQDFKYRKSAEQNIQWAIKQQRDNGWFDHNIMEPGEPVFTHAIAYSTRGILECGTLLKEEWLIQAATKTANALLKLVRKDGSFPGSFIPEWKPTTRSVCLTGTAQTALIWLRLHEITGSALYLKAATHGIDYLIGHQERSWIFQAIDGAVAGSTPIQGNYLPFKYLNWAAKFFVDAILLEQKIVGCEDFQ